MECTANGSLELGFEIWNTTRTNRCIYTGLFKIIVGVQMSSGNSAPNSGKNHNLTIPFEGGMNSFKRQCVYVCVYPGTEGTNQNRH